MLEGHEYDPNCKFCCENKFVKDANKAVKELPSITEGIETLRGEISDYDYKIENVGIDQIKKICRRLVTLEIKSTACFPKYNSLSLG